MQRLLSLSVYVIAFGIAMATAPKPHVLFILVDDLGFAEVGFHRAEFNDTTKEVAISPDITATTIVNTFKTTDGLYISQSFDCANIYSTDDAFAYVDLPT